MCIVYNFIMRKKNYEISENTKKILEQSYRESQVSDNYEREKSVSSFKTENSQEIKENSQKIRSNNMNSCKFSEVSNGISKNLNQEQERKSIEFSDNEQEEDYDNEQASMPRESMGIDSEFKKKMDSTDAFILKYNKEGVKLEEEDKSDMYPFDSDQIQKVAVEPRNTYEAMLCRVDRKEKESKRDQANMSFAQKKRALIGTEI